MWLLKGTLLSVWLFSFGTIAYLYFALFRRLPSDAGSIDVRTFSHLTVLNPVWWIALAVCLAIGLFITRSWAGKPALWIALVVTELFPVALLVGIFVLVGKMRQMAGK